MDARAHDARWLSLSEYAALPRDDGFRDELSRGLLVREPQPASPHDVVVGNVFDMLRTQQRLGRGHASVAGGFLLSVDPPTVRGPDAAFIAARHLPRTLPDGWWPLAPDLAVEVLSPSNRPAELRAKLRDYFGAGTRLVWVVDPRTRSVAVHHADGAVQRLHAGDELDGGEVLPELRVPVSDLFAWP